jgi:hypothetical protein
MSTAFEPRTFAWWVAVENYTNHKTNVLLESGPKIFPIWLYGVSSMTGQTDSFLPLPQWQTYWSVFWVELVPCWMKPHSMLKLGASQLAYRSTWLIQRYCHQYGRCKDAGYMKLNTPMAAACIDWLGVYPSMVRNSGLITFDWDYLSDQN